MVCRLIPQAASLLFLKEEQLESAATTQGSEAREGLMPVWQCREEVGVEIWDRGMDGLKMLQTEDTTGCAR